LDYVRVKKHECGGIRTHDLCLRRAALYPAELRIQVLCMLWSEAVLVNRRGREILREFTLRRYGGELFWICNHHNEITSGFFNYACFDYNMSYVKDI